MCCKCTAQGKQPDTWFCHLAMSVAQHHHYQLIVRLAACAHPRHVHLLLIWHMSRGGGQTWHANSLRSYAACCSASAVMPLNPDSLLPTLPLWQVQHQLSLPALCSCGHRTSPLDPMYPTRCCSNCPLHHNQEGWRRLVLGLGLMEAGG